MPGIQMAVHVDCQDDYRVTFEFAYGKITCRLSHGGDILSEQEWSVGEIREVARTLHAMADAATRGDGEE